MAMGANIKGISAVTLAKASTAYHFTANGLSGLTVTDLSAGSDTIQAGGANQVLTDGAAGKLTMKGSSAGGTTFRDTSALFNGDTIGNFSAPGDVINLTNMAQAPSSALSRKCHWHRRKAARN